MKAETLSQVQNVEMQINRREEKMGKKSDKIKVLFEKARSGNVKELSSLNRAFTNWLRFSFQEERSQPLDAQVLEKFLNNLSKLIREIEKIENVYWKSKAVEMLSRFMETIYTTRNLEPAIKHLESILHDFAGISRDQDMIKKLGDTIDLLTAQPRQTAIESPPTNDKKFIPTRKKRGGCNGSSKDSVSDVGSTTKGSTIDVGGDVTVEGFINNKIEAVIKGGSLELLDQPKTQIRSVIIKELIKNTVEDIIENEIKEILGEQQGEINIETIEASKMNRIENYAIDIIKKTLKEMYPVTFRAHWKRYTMPKLETDLLVYLYNGLRGEQKAMIDFKKLIKQPEKYEFNTSKPVYLKKGTEILIKPEMPGFVFEPSLSSIILRKDWHRLNFRMQPLIEGSFPELGEKIEGQVKLSVGPIPIGEIKINVIIKDYLPEDEKNIKIAGIGSAYQNIFASYAHEDKEIVKKMGALLAAFGDKFMRDQAILRSGDKWDPKLLELIQIADVFQLFWSKASKASKYVEMEWREALKRDEAYLIRPAYWENPMPDPPPELEKIHFNDIKEVIQMFKPL